MGTRTYSRRGVNGQRVLTAEGRRRAGVEAIDILGNPVAGQTPEEVVNTPAPTIELPPITNVERGLSRLQDLMRAGEKIPKYGDGVFDYNDPDVQREMNEIDFSAYWRTLTDNEETINEGKKLKKRIQREIRSLPIVYADDLAKNIPNMTSMLRQYVDGMEDPTKPESVREQFKQELYGFLMNGYTPRGGNMRDGRQFPPFTRAAVDDLISEYKRYTVNQGILPNEPRYGQFYLPPQKSNNTLEQGLRSGITSQFENLRRAKAESYAAIVLGNYYRNNA